jgi:hypothetical protein
MRIGAVLGAAAVLLLAAFSSVPSAGAEPRLIDQSVANEYPNRIVFRLTAEADVNITDVALHYEITGSNTLGFNRPPDLTPARFISVDLPLDVNTLNSYIPVGTEFVYYWEIEAADGSRTTTPEQRWLFLPPNREWRSVENGFMVVYFHGDRQALATPYLRAAEETYSTIGGLLKTELTETPVRVILFANGDEMAPARPGRGGTFDAAVTTCGTKLNATVVFVIPQACGTGDRTDTLRHELAHILNQSAGESALGKLPSWLDEGTAVVAQSEPGQGFVGPFQAAVRTGRLIPFAQMGTPSNDPRQVGLFYGQSYFMVRYLLDKGGEEKFAELFATIKSGVRFDEALRRVYGFDLAGFEQEFRAAHNVGGAAPTTAPTQAPRQQPPTAAPTRAPGQVATQSGGDDDGVSRVTIGIVLLAVLFLLLAVLAYLFLMMQQSHPATPPGSPAAPSPPAREPPPADSPQDEPPAG